MADDIQRTVCVRTSWRWSPLCSLYTQSRMLFALYSPFLFARLPAAVAWRHQRINAPFLWLMPPNDRRYLVLLSHVSLARPATNGANPFTCCSKISCPTIITDRSLSVLSALDICKINSLNSLLTFTAIFKRRLFIITTWFFLIMYNFRCYSISMNIS